MPEKMTVTVRGVPLEVEFSFFSGESGTTDKFGVPMEPNINDEIEVLAVTVLEPAEIMRWLDDAAILNVRQEVLSQRGKL